jgi:hypothetical protein
MLENIGFKTYLVLSDDHAYGLVCGVETGDLRGYVEKSLLEEYASEDVVSDGELVYQDDNIYFKRSYRKNFVLDSYSTYYYGGAGEEIEYPFLNKVLEYSLAFSSSVDVYVVSGKADYELLADGESFQVYSDCTELNAITVKNKCTIGTNGGIAINNRGSEDVVVDMELDVFDTYSSYELLKNVTMTSYTIDGETCVVLDGTSGKYGYPGLNPSDLQGIRVAIDPMTKEILHLQ